MTGNFLEQDVTYSSAAFQVTWCIATALLDYDVYFPWKVEPCSSQFIYFTETNRWSGASATALSISPYVWLVFIGGVYFFLIDIHYIPMLPQDNVSVLVTSMRLGDAYLCFWMVWLCLLFLMPVPASHIAWFLRCFNQSHDAEKHVSWFQQHANVFCNYYLSYSYSLPYYVPRCFVSRAGWKMLGSRCC